MKTVIEKVENNVENERMLFTVFSFSCNVLNCHFFRVIKTLDCLEEG